MEAQPERLCLPGHGLYDRRGVARPAEDVAVVHVPARKPEAQDLADVVVYAARIPDCAGLRGLVAETDSALLGDYLAYHRRYPRAVCEASVHRLYLTCRPAAVDAGEVAAEVVLHADGLVAPPPVRLDNLLREAPPRAIHAPALDAG